MQSLDEIIEYAIQSINDVKDLSELDNIRVQILGKKGSLTSLLQNLGKLPPSERKEAGQKINKEKQKVVKLINEKKEELEKAALKQKLTEETIDISLAGRNSSVGGIHPVTKSIRRLETIFKELGFNIETGPEIENTYYNFEALNMPETHPARSGHDTFYFNPNLLLRTHTSGVQIRTMENQKPPFKFICSGRVYRNDYDQTHTPMFHQMEGVLIDKNINFSHLKGILFDVISNFFEEELEIRLRPSFFPFTEPSAEVDIRKKGGKWLEILGCGMVHPNVLKAVNIDPEEYSGFAFGFGIERFTMLRYCVNDLRSFFENDLRFLEQFN